MFQLNVIEPSSSPYSAPIVLARKKDGTNRFCIDFRKLNNITVSMQNQCLIQIAIFFKVDRKALCDEDRSQKRLLACANGK